jgi:hypothetical protein
MAAASPAPTTDGPATHGPTTHGPTTSAASTARSWLDAVTERDLDRLAALLAPDVWTRVLLPRQLVEERTDRDVLDRLAAWFVTPEEVLLVDAAHHSLAGREHVRYAFLLRPVWDPARWHLIEQAGYLRVAGGVVRRIDLVCTGFCPRTELVATRGRWVDRHT